MVVPVEFKAVLNVGLTATENSARPFFRPEKVDPRNETLESAVFVVVFPFSVAEYSSRDEELSEAIV